MKKKKGEEEETNNERDRKAEIHWCLTLFTHHYSMPQGECLKQQKYICCTTEN